jgi:hypothetical protein
MAIRGGSFSLLIRKEEGVGNPKNKNMVNSLTKDLT